MWQEAIDLIRGDFFADFYLADGESFEDCALREAFEEIGSDFAQVRIFHRQFLHVREAFWTSGREFGKN